MIWEGKRIFLDTNILIYGSVKESPFHKEAVNKINQLYEASLLISRQVIREYLSVMSKPGIFENPLSCSILIQRIKFFETHFEILNEDELVFQELVYLLERYEIGGKQIHDANIVATMRANNISYLLTHNIDDFNRYREIIDLIPIIEM